MARFDCDSVIRIDDTVAFGQAVSRHVPGFTGGAEGLCRYQSARAFERDLGFVDGINVTLPDGTQAYDQARLLQVLDNGIGVVPLFLKEIRFSCEAEYRFIWFSSSSVAPYLIVKVPEAREFCSRPGDIVVESGDGPTGG